MAQCTQEVSRGIGAMAIVFLFSSWYLIQLLLALEISNFGIASLLLVNNLSIAFLCLNLRCAFLDEIRDTAMEL